MGWFMLKHIFSTIPSIINITRLSNQEKDLETLILREQLYILQRKHISPIKPNRVEKVTLTVLTARLRRILADLQINLTAVPCNGGIGNRFSVFVTEITKLTFFSRILILMFKLGVDFSSLEIDRGGNKLV